MSGIGPSSASQSGVQHALGTLGVTEAAFGLVKGLRDGLPVSSVNVVAPFNVGPLRNRS